MTDFLSHKNNLNEQGFSIIENCFSSKEISELGNLIKKNKFSFSERQVVKRFPQILNNLEKNKSFKELFNSVCGKDYFLSKAIYFNKERASNWFVSYHQDLSISVKRKQEYLGYTNWTNKKGQLGVIPPLNILENTVTFRIHLDDTDESNGVLKVISKSHTKGLIRIDEKFNSSKFGKEVSCNVKSGGIMLMKPLLLHSSPKSTLINERRVIHLEFCNKEIPMNWLEKKYLYE